MRSLPNTSRNKTLIKMKISEWMVKAIYFLKPAWCGKHSAALWPEQDLQSVTRAAPFQAVAVHLGA